jgi:two-component system sensor histidine kinase PilS (NtrC family)
LSAAIVLESASARKAAGKAALARVETVNRVEFRGMSLAAAPETSTAIPRRPRDHADEMADFSWRVLTLLNLFRAILGIVLLLTFVFVTEPRIVGEHDPDLARAALLAMLGFGAAEFFLLRWRKWRASAHTYMQFALDLVTMIALLHASEGVSSGLGGLLIVPVGSLALLIPADRSFLLASLATLALLVQQTFAHLQGITSSAEFVPTGILGAVIFAITGVVQLLRRRIVETEALAEQRGVDLQNLVELNEYIIQHLRESIVVVDSSDRVHLMNESAGKLLRATPAPGGVALASLSEQLAARLRRWRIQGEDLRESTIIMGREDGSLSIHPHFAPLGAGRNDGVVIFLEDTSLIAERVQQTKLAALGRLSASIAHEIRNPLGALSHAGQLLAESASIAPGDRRLTDIIRVNSRRVSQIVDSVLALSRRDKTQPERLNLKDWAQDFAKEFTQTQELYEDAVTVRSDAEDPEVEMDRTHLHQVVWNLCDNAVKYASKTAGAIAVELGCGSVETSGRPYLEVADRGPGIAADKVEQIFEPFYTGQPGGTGLGLYISRELCERNGATLRYHARPDGGSLFRIIFADPKRWHAGER